MVAERSISFLLANVSGMMWCSLHTVRCAFLYFFAPFVLLEQQKIVCPQLMYPRYIIMPNHPRSFSIRKGKREFSPRLPPLSPPCLSCLFLLKVGAVHSLVPKMVPHPVVGGDLIGVVHIVFGWGGGREKPEPNSNALIPGHLVPQSDNLPPVLIVSQKKYSLCGI